MIPKVVHYCWFGNSLFPEELEKNIGEWKNKLPDYKFILWNESNFDIDSFEFTKEAYKEKKYAFVSDVARIYGLVKYGGLYFDTDIEVVKSFSSILTKHKQIFSLENNNNVVATSFMATEANNNLMITLLEDYKSRRFYLANGKLNTVPNTDYLTEKLLEEGLRLDNFTDDYQSFGDEIAVYSQEYFSSYNLELSKPIYSDKTYLVHHFDASWETSDFKVKQNIKKILIILFGEKVYLKLKNTILKKKAG